MTATRAVGIDLGTTYSCIAYLNEQGEPVSIPNREGEISTPSVVMYDQGEAIVGTEALRNAIMHPHQVVQNAKRSMGDGQKQWTIQGKSYTPIDVAAAVLRKLLADAQQQIGPIDRAVITVPAQFSERQRLATVEAGQRAGLKTIDIINEPVAAALCYVLGTEGLWFTELAHEQRILVYDLGGGTFDLSLVSYHKDHVRVLASTGDLHLGGIDWNQCLLNAVADQFLREFGEDPRRDAESLQHLAWEVEQCKRSLSVRPRAALIVQHAGRRKTYQIEREQFHQLTQHLVRRTQEITSRLITQHRRGAAHLDLTVLSAGGASRMPMIEQMLNGLKGARLSKVLSPDQAIAHGAAYYAGMLLTNSEFVHALIDPKGASRLARLRQQSVNARALGILVRDMQTNQRVPYYLVPANRALPAAATKSFGTVVPNQQKVSLSIVESGATAGEEYVELGTCKIDGLPPNLPAASLIEVTIKYDASARVTVFAKELTEGKEARTEIDRSENVVTRQFPDEEVLPLPATAPRQSKEIHPSGIPVAKPAAPKTQPAARPPAAKPVDPLPGLLESPELLCEQCGQALNVRGECPQCASRRAEGNRSAPAKPAAQRPAAQQAAAQQTAAGIPPVRPKPVPVPPAAAADAARKKPPIRPPQPGTKGGKVDPGEQEFWKYVDP
jgi:molecular chaperone DnaK